MNLVEGHLTERVVLYLMLACTLIVSMGSIWCMRWAMQVQERMNQEILARIDQVIANGEQGNGKVSIAKERRSALGSPRDNYADSSVALPSQLRDQLALASQ